MKLRKLTILMLLLQSMFCMALIAEELRNEVSPQLLLQKALYAEQSEGDLEKAIGLYKQVAEAGDNAAACAAQAYFQLAQCYQKKGMETEAIDYYKMLVGKYPKAEPWTEKAAEKLKGLVPPANIDRSGKIPSVSKPDFDNPEFWEKELMRTLETVRTLEGDFLGSDWRYDKAGKQTNHSQYNVRFKWDRDNQWYDYSHKRVDDTSYSVPERYVLGPKYSWHIEGSGRHATKSKAGGGFNSMRYQFIGGDEWWPDDYMYINCVSGFVGSEFIRMLKIQKMPLGQFPFVLEDGGKGRKLLKYNMKAFIPDAGDVNPYLVFVVNWDRGIKLLEIKLEIKELDVNLVKERYSGHRYYKGAWVPERIEEYSYHNENDILKEGFEPQIDRKEVVIVENLQVNRNMLSSEFENVTLPVGVNVNDKIIGKRYIVWPDMEKIKATGGKEKVAISGWVYLDGKPAKDVKLHTSTRYDPDEDSWKSVYDDSASDGSFKLEGLVPGFEYHVSATLDSGITATDKVRLSELGKNYTGLKINMTSGLSVTGLITGPDNEPIAEALVKFNGHPFVKADNEGTYIIEGIKPNQGYEVEAAAQGYAPLDPSGDSIVSNYQLLFEDNGTPKPFNIQLGKEVPLYGRVIDQDGKPVEGVRLNVWTAPFATSERWQWYDTHTDKNGDFRVGNLGDRCYTFFVGSCGNVYHNPSDSPIIFHITGDSLMPDPLPGRAMVDTEILEEADEFERPFRRYYRLKEHADACSHNSGGKYISDLIVKLQDEESRYAAFAELGSIHSWQALSVYEQILSGKAVDPSKYNAGAASSFSSTIAGKYDTGKLPKELINCQDSTTVKLVMRALARNGFVDVHADLLIDKLNSRNTSIMNYASVALAEMTGRYFGTNVAKWKDWLETYKKNQRLFDYNSNRKLFTSLCKVMREYKDDDDFIERITPAWKTGRKGTIKFFDILKGEHGPELVEFLCSINIDGGDESAIHGTHTHYWPTDIFKGESASDNDLRVKFEKEYTYKGCKFIPDKLYDIPAVFGGGYNAKWSIYDLKLDHIEER